MIVSFKRILLNFYLVLQVFAVSIGLLCGFISYSETDLLKDFKNYAKEDIPLKVEKVKNSVVMLYIKGYNGTGFILEDGILVTNIHVLKAFFSKNSFDNKIEFNSLSQIEISQEDRLLDVQITSIQALDPVHDLALLNIKGSEIPPAIKKTRRKVDLKKEKLFFVGYPHGKLKAMGQKGPIEIFKSKAHAEVHMPISTNDIGGASGSPIVNQKGEVVGVLDSKSNFENKGVFSDSKHLFSLRNAKYGVQCSKNTSIKNCFKQMEDFLLKEILKGDVYAKYQFASNYQLAFNNMNFNNHKEGMKWLEQAAQKGFALAQNELGYKFFKLEQYKEAIKWFKLAAQNGHAHSAFQLGEMYYYGKVVPQNDKKAFEYFKLAAQAGNKKAQDYLNKLKNEKCIEVFNKGAHS